MSYGQIVCFNLAGPYVIGVDAGGTHTRAALVTFGGAVAGYGAGPGANYNSGGDAAAALSTALEVALDDIDPTRVAGGVFGIAGAGAAGRARAVGAANAAWWAAGIPGGPLVVPDIVVGFAAATAKPAGIIVFAGTGAGAAVINDDAIVRRADGYGWLVGDDGSAVWIGREAVRAVLRAYDGRGDPTMLTESVPRAMLGAAADHLLTGIDVTALPAGRDTPFAAGPSAVSSSWALPQAILKEVYGAPPADLGRLAPLVGSAAEAGDAVAGRIVEEAARWLLGDVDAVRPTVAELPRGPDEDAGPGLVVAGSLLHQGPVADAVRAGLRSRFGIDPAPARDGALGAARLALRRLGLQTGFLIDRPSRDRPCPDGPS